MQGNDRNTNSRIDEAFVDKAWGEMHQLLDKEMPVAPKKERKGYLLLLLLLLTGFAAGVGLMYSIGSFPDQISTQKEAEPVPTVKKTRPQASIMDEPTKKVDPPTSSNTISTKEKTKTISSTLTSAPHRSISSTTPSKNTLSKSKNKAIASTLPSLNKELNEVNKAVNEQVQELGKPIAFEGSNTGLETKEKDNNSRDISELAVLPIQEQSDKAAHANELVAKVNPLELSSLPLLPFEEEVSENTMSLLSIPTKKWKWSAQAGVLAGTPGALGFDIGLNTEYRISPKMALQTGLHYTSYRWNKGTENVDFTNLRLSDNSNDPDGIVDPIAAPIVDINNYFTEENEAVQEVIESVRATGNVPLVSYANAINIPLENRNYLSVPLLFSYRANPLLKLNIGFQFGFRINNLLSGLAKSNNDLAFAEDSSVSGNSQSSSTNSLNKTEVSSILGFTIFPTQRTGIDFRYNFGLTDYTNNEVFGITQFDNNKSFQLSLIHYFGRY